MTASAQSIKNNTNTNGEYSTVVKAIAEGWWLQEQISPGHIHEPMDPPDHSI